MPRTTRLEFEGEICGLNRPKNDAQHAPFAPLVTDVFRRSVSLHGERVALEIPAGVGHPVRITVTYRELAERAQTIALQLAPIVARDRLVALVLERGTAELYAAQLGVLLSGAAFVCLDPWYPDERLRVILRDAAPVLVLTTREHKARVTDLVTDPRSVEWIDALIEREASSTAPLPVIDATSLAYVIYTSGTTGNPKGVMIEHRSLANLVASDVERFALGVEDRVVQGSSPIYDSSVEETWLALSVGATLVVMDEDTARSGPDIVPWLARERITVFCPPPTLLRSTGCREPWRELSDLRLLYVGGEQLTEDVAELWGRDRWLENGYGPTECTVTVIRGRILPGERITIGTPLRGHTAHLLDEHLEPVNEGEAGELCIAGPGLARGYLGREDLTQERFPHHPKFGRLYRTGDLAVQRDGVFACLGRIDSQVKIRGHRVELTEIDRHLSAMHGVREAASILQSRGTGELLAAWIVPDDPMNPPRLDSVRRALASTLPEHMIPTRIGLLDRLPTTPGGKLDRGALPPIDGDAAPATVAPGDAMEELVVATMCEALALDDVSVTANFFHDLGGDSLRAAMVVSRLRRSPLTAAVTVRDLYDYPTARDLTGRLRDTPPTTPTRNESPPSSRFAPRSVLPVGLLQTVWLLGGVLTSGALLWWAVTTLTPWLLARLGLVGFLVTLPVLSFVATVAWTPLAVALTIVAKKTLIGRYRPGRHPAWGSFHGRHWIVQRVASSIPWSLVNGTAFQAAILRRLGARIGERVHIHRGVNLTQGGWDLLELGDDVTLSQEASVRVVDLDRGTILFGPVTLGAGVTLDIRAGVGPDSVIEQNGYLGPLAVLEPGGRIPEGRRFDGVEAIDSGAAEDPPSRIDGYSWSPLTHDLAILGARLVLSLCLWIPEVLLALAVGRGTGVNATSLAHWLSAPHDVARVIAIFGALAAVTLALHLILQGLACRWLSPKTPTVCSLWSPHSLRLWLGTGLLERAGDWLSGTLLWPAWLRLSGMKLGKGSEISTIIDVVPTLVTLGDESFFADGIYLGGPKVHRGVVSTAYTTLGRNTFLGNHAVIPKGTHLKDGILLGVSTVADPSRMGANTSWFGNPAFSLPRREIVAMPRSMTHEPDLARYLTRVVFETLRFALPTGPIAAFVLWLVLAQAGNVMSVTMATLVAGATLAGSVIALKWGLLGRVKPGQHALWSCWCSRWDLLYMAWSRFARPVLTSLEQTPWLAVYLRLMGCRIGKRALLGHGFAQVVDPDMIEIEDDATANGLFQAHSFEDRVLKIDHVVIGARATVSAGSLLFYGAHVGSGAVVTPHSVVMKRERLSPERVYRGCPTRDDGPA